MFEGDRIENRETDQSFSKPLESNDAGVRSEDMKNERKIGEELSGKRDFNFRISDCKFPMRFYRKSIFLLLSKYLILYSSYAAKNFELCRL